LWPVRRGRVAQQPRRFTEGDRLGVAPAHRAAILGVVEQLLQPVVELQQGQREALHLERGAVVADVVPHHLEALLPAVGGQPCDIADPLRDAVMRAKAPRRLHVGPRLTFLFENHDTMRY
jgi:hypothetical protein